MVQRVMRLANDAAEVELAPHLGGAVAGYHVRHRGELIPIFQTKQAAGRTGVFALGSNVLAPWSNRISGGGFAFDGRFHALSPNISGEPYPNHGNAFDAAWTVLEASPERVLLGLNSNGPGPFRYAARLSYVLEGPTLSMTLKLTNKASIALPHGGGFHPWFVRTKGMRVAFRAAGVWTETADHLPDRYLPTQGVWDFAQLRMLPDSWLNNAFTGWDGHVRIEWPEHGLAAELTGAKPLETLIIYSPDGEADYVSIEPVSHSVDAHNRHDAGTSKPQVLAPGETLTLSAKVAPMPLVQVKSTQT